MIERKQMVYIMTFSEASKLKKAFDAKFHENVHYHDMCDYQYFELDVVTEDRVEFIKNYFENLGMTAVFNEEQNQFTVKK